MTNDEYDAARKQVQEALALLLGDDEIIVSWVVSIDVIGPNDRRYLAHRAGGGADGSSTPMMWHAIGMYRAALLSVEDQLRELTFDPDNTDDEEEQ